MQRQNDYIIHYGVGHDKGGHSGRYPWGSGEKKDGRKRRKKIGDEIMKKSIDFHANTKKDDLEKLNIYNDYKQAGRINMTRSNAMRQRVKDGDIDANYKIMEKLIGSSNMEKMLNSQYDKAKTMHDYSDKKVNELLEKLKDVPITQVDSYRYINFGNNGSISWMGKKYVRR